MASGSITNAVIDELLNAASVSSIVGTKIRPFVSNQRDTVPNISVKRISGLHVHNASGASGITQDRVQVTVWESTYSKMETLATAVRESLQGFRGTLGTAQPADVRGIVLDNDPDLQGVANGNARTPIGRALDFKIWHAESIPVFA